jgi:Papain-like cysteine protease AvrRpt2
MQMQSQQMSNWCWAAVAASVDAYYDPQSAKSQCTIAAAVIGTACCPPNGNCDKTERLDDALRKVPLRFEVRKPLQFADIKKQIDFGTPVCVRIGWPDGTGHFAAIDGYGQSPDRRYVVHVVDPYYPDGTWDLDEFTTAYQGAGQWTATFLVR